MMSRLSRRHACTFALGCALALTSACGASSAPVARTFPSTERAIGELKRGWADAVVGDYPVVAHTVRESMGTLEIAGEQFATGFFGIGVNKSAPELKAAIAGALHQLAADQTYLEILRKWALQVGKVDVPAPAAALPATQDVPQLADGVLHVGIELAFAPMKFRDELKKPAGADVELIQAIGKALGVEVELIDMQLDGLVSAVTTGQVDVLISALTVTPEREAQIDFVPYLEMGSGILVGMGNPKRIRRPSDLCGRTVALQEGTTQIEALRSIRCP